MPLVDHPSRQNSRDDNGTTTDGSIECICPFTVVVLFGQFSTFCANNGSGCPRSTMLSSRGRSSLGPRCSGRRIQSRGARVGQAMWSHAYRAAAIFYRFIFFLSCAAALSFARTTRRLRPTSGSRWEPSFVDGGSGSLIDGFVCDQWHRSVGRIHF